MSTAIAPCSLALNRLLRHQMVLSRFQPASLSCTRSWSDSALSIGGTPGLLEGNGGQVLVQVFGAGVVAVYAALSGVFFLLVAFLQISLGYSTIAAGTRSDTLSPSQMRRLDFFLYQLKQRGIYAHFVVKSLNAPRRDDAPPQDECRADMTAN